MAVRENDTMKRQIALGSLVLALAGSVFGQGAYVNNSVVRVPPMDPALLMVHAESFENNNEFTAVFTNVTMNSQLWDSTGTKRFVNNGTMIGMPGFAFDYRPVGSGLVRAADSFENYGNIYVDSSYATYYGFSTLFFSAGLPQLKINSLNLTNRGEMNLGYNSLGILRGSNVDLSQGSITMQNTGTNLANQVLFFNQGWWDGYWGLGTNYFSPAGFFEFIPQTSPYHSVTNRSYLITTERLEPPTPLAYLDERIDPVTGVRTVHAAFVGNTNSLFNTRVFFNGALAGTVLELSAYITNSAGVFTNVIYIEDTFGVRTNFELLANGVSGGQTTYMPWNYWIWPNWYGTFLFGVPASPVVIPAGTFGPGSASEWTAYRAIFDPASQLLSDVYGQNITNAAARVEISGTNYLDLNEATISSGSYLLLQGTNKFGGSAGARVESPYTDLNLRVPDGKFTVTNLLVPFVLKNEGTVDLFSTRWTTVVGGVTNIYHVMYADVKLAHMTPSRIQDMKLVSGNTGTGEDSIVVHDVLNVTKRMVFDTDRLTFATNDVDSETAFGGVNMLSGDVVWANSTPRLMYLTNQGGIQSYNQMYFGRGANTPYDKGDDMPYKVFHNSGAVTNYGSVVHATEYLNSGVMHAETGPITLHENVSAIMTNGVTRAGGITGKIEVESGSLYVSNHIFQAASSLRLSITNSLDDGTAFVISNGVTVYPHADNVTNKNFWVAGRQGVTFDRLAPRASLLATTISNYVDGVAQYESPITWAGANLGRTSAGYTNNGALGRLILDGGKAGKFRFKGLPGGNNALYVDYLELQNYATNRNTAGEFTRLVVDAGMTVYFAQAVANGVSVAEKLDGKAGGRFVWLSSFNEGHFSSKQVVYPDGSTNRLNTALVESCTMDSDGDGTVNCQDLSPIIVGASSAGGTFTQAANGQIEISWNAPSFSTNQLYWSDSLNSPTWQLVTNAIVGPGGASNKGTLLLGPVGGRVTVREPAHSGLRFYRPKVMEQ